MAYKEHGDISPFKKKIWLSSPTMHGGELEYMTRAYDTNWMSTVGENINVIEKEVAELVGEKYAVALSTGTAALHLATRLAAEKLYGKKRAFEGTLAGKTVFASDLTFDATLDPVAYEGGKAVLIDTEYDTWNLDPKALERAFSLYPKTKLVIVAHLYGTPCKFAEIEEICSRHGAVIVEDAAESLGALYLKDGKFCETGSLCGLGCLSFNGNKVITGAGGGMFVTDNAEDAAKVRKWSNQSCDEASWYQHSEIGYNYRISNVLAGVIRGQLPHLDEHIAQKKAIYERYRAGFSDLPVKMNPFDEKHSVPNYWLSCLTVDREYMCRQTRDEHKATFVPEKGKSCPTEILEALAAKNAEGRPIWKPMHLQPLYKGHGFVSADDAVDVGADIFERGLCLPSDNKLKPDEQEVIIELVRRCFE